MPRPATTGTESRSSSRGSRARLRPTGTTPTRRRSSSERPGSSQRSRKRYAIPIVPLDAADLRADRRGVTTHVAVSRAWGRSDHTDPGRAFPLGKVLARVKELRGSGPPRPKPRPKARPTLRQGDRGFQVKRAQRLLNEKPGIQIAADGIFGSETKAAVIRFQRRRRVVATGVIGPRTWAALMKRPRGTGRPGRGEDAPGLFALGEAPDNVL
jgi:hypothetical protein